MSRQIISEAIYKQLPGKVKMVLFEKGGSSVLLRWPMSLVGKSFSASAYVDNASIFDFSITETDLANGEVTLVATEGQVAGLIDVQGLRSWAFYFGDSPSLLLPKLAGPIVIVRLDFSELGGD